MARDYLKHSNHTAQSIQLTGKYFWTTPKSIKPIIIHTTNVSVEMMMINGTKYPLNRSASCWMGAYENKTPRPREITIHKEIHPPRHGWALEFWAPALTRLLITPYSTKSAWIYETLGITSKRRKLMLGYFFSSLHYLWHLSLFYQFHDLSQRGVIAHVSGINEYRAMCIYRPSNHYASGFLRDRHGFSWRWGRTSTVTPSAPHSAFMWPGNSRHTHPQGRGDEPPHLWWGTHPPWCCLPGFSHLLGTSPRGQPWWCRPAAPAPWAPAPPCNKAAQVTRTATSRSSALPVGRPAWVPDQVLDWLHAPRFIPSSSTHFICSFSDRANMYCANTKGQALYLALAV